MKKIIKINCLIGLLVLGLTSCQEDSIPEYSGPTVVNMQSNNESEFDVTFLEMDAITDKTFKIDISVQGEFSEQERVLKLKLGEKQTAVIGKNFDMPMEVVFEPGRLDTSIICTVYKEGLDYDGFYLDLQVEPNEDFEGGGVYGKILATFKYGFPKSWYASAGQIYMAEYILGKCTQAKYQFVYEVIGTIDLVEYADTPFASGLGTLKAELNALLEENPRIDDDGSNMVFKF